ncbi:MAG: sulfatase-like hydrolase/transferase [Elusimicrobiota bacterium]|jgi:hypothetical protein|nr:sulfatase-like hydrolase/transferase [Elusimicrobiota bacterium]
MIIARGTFFRLKLSAVYTAIIAVVFFIGRIVLYLSSYKFFEKLSPEEVFFSFIEGFRFDLIVTAVFYGLFILLINIPTDSKRLIKICCAFMNVFLLTFSFLLAADIIYFKLFLKHFTTEPLLIGDHFTYFLSLAFGDYIYVTFIIVVVSFLLFYFSFKAIDKYYCPPNKKVFFNIATFIILVVLIILSFRGRIDKTPLDIVEAYSMGGHIGGELILNGVFTSFESLRERRFPNKINIDYGDALKVVRSNLIDNDEEIFYDEKFPLMRKRIKFNVNAKGYNIVIILLESWQKDYIDSLSGSKYGVTPNFDALIKDALVFDRFYANGQRSLMGMMSIFYSMPFIKGIPYMAHGLENFEQIRLPIMLAKNGYDNVFVAGDKREADKAYYVANFLGFKNAYFKEDIPVKNDYVQISKGYDLETFEFFLDKVNLLKRPFFAFIFTTTTHIPYAKTILKSLEKYPEDGTEKMGYLNRLYYADYSLGQFFQKARKQPWFNKTIFILLADHQAYTVGRDSSELEKTPADRGFKIPMIIYAPSLFKHALIKEIGSQNDIIPTIIDALNISDPYSSMGKSLFSKTKNRFVFLSYEGEEIFLINNEGTAEQDWKDPSNSDIDMSKSNAILLFSIEKVLYQLVVSDSWYDQKNI